ncbi:hypothetical protein [Fundidesulfovibrio terrae]|uniref:hypothetical protein n=1 Tax=Fundidesulfovibrio terrae TaxID=2922866 RepID=UPI001FB0322F|nr:hypothetical protein [Fundidesulfovibrio terrae]
MSRLELERQTARGEEVGRFLACDAVREVIEEQLAAKREAILNLKSAQAGEFTRIKSAFEALEELVAALTSVAELGEQARERLGQDESGPENGGRVL